MAMDTEPERLRQTLVDALCRSRAIRSPAVEAAFRRVPRHGFVPQIPPAEAYRDDAIITRRTADGLPSSSSSQPTISALMLEQLGLESGHRVLEVGAGTGYNAALIHEIVGPAGAVVTVDIQADVAAEAAQHLVASGYGDVEVAAADGGFGYPPRAPYDRIIVTASTADLPPSWRAQLAAAGVLVVPLRLHTQTVSAALVRDGEVLRSRSLEYCGFMHLQGAFGGAEPLVAMGDGLFLSGPQADAVPIDLLAELLSETPARVGGLIVPVNSFGLGGGLGIYLALQEPGVIDVFAVEPARWGFHAVSGVLDIPARSLCLIRQDAAVVYGADDAAGRIRRRAREWVEMGRPGLDRLRIEVYPGGAAPQGPDRWRLSGRWSDVAVWFEGQGPRGT